MGGKTSEVTLNAESVPSSGRQRRALAKRVSYRKCPSCREKALIIVKDAIVCNHCGHALIDGRACDA